MPPYLDALPAVVFLLFGAEAELGLEPAQDVVEGLGAGDEVEGSGERAAVIKVADPQLGASELPLLVRLTLYSLASREVSAGLADQMR